MSNVILFRVARETAAWISSVAGTLDRVVPEELDEEAFFGMGDDD